MLKLSLTATARVCLPKAVTAAARVCLPKAVTAAARVCLPKVVSRRITAAARVCLPKAVTAAAMWSAEGCNGGGGSMAGPTAATLLVSVHLPRRGGGCRQ